MKLCSHGCDGMADTEMELMSRKDFKMDSNVIDRLYPEFSAMD